MAGARSETGWLGRAFLWRCLLSKDCYFINNPPSTKYPPGSRHCTHVWYLIPFVLSVMADVGFTHPERKGQAAVRFGTRSYPSTDSSGAAWPPSLLTYVRGAASSQAQVLTWDLGKEPSCSSLQRAKDVPLALAATGRGTRVSTD